MANQIHNQNDALTRVGGNTVVAEWCSTAALAITGLIPNQLYSVSPGADALENLNGRRATCGKD
jgi:hypothetical protein